MGGHVATEPEPRKGSYTMDNSFLEMRVDSLTARLLCRVMERMLRRGLGDRADPSDPAYRMMYTSALDAPLRTAVISGEGRLPEPAARALLALCNGRVFRAIGELLRG